jgi:hypothetical protein
MLLRGPLEDLTQNGKFRSRRLRWLLLSSGSSEECNMTKLRAQEKPNIVITALYYEKSEEYTMFRFDDSGQAVFVQLTVVETQ